MTDNTPLQSSKVPPKSGMALTVKQGQVLRISDIAGGQVADLFCFALGDLNERLSAGHTLDYNNKIFYSTGDVLYSNQSRAMLRIVDDTAGPHFMMYAPCSQVMYEKTYGVTEPHPNCLDNFVGPMSAYGVRAEHISIPLNLFMNIELDAAGGIRIQPPSSVAGDHVDLRAEMDLLVGVTACSAGLCNDFSWSEIGVVVYEGNGSGNQ